MTLQWPEFYYMVTDESSETQFDVPLFSNTEKQNPSLLWQNTNHMVSNIYCESIPKF